MNLWRMTRAWRNLAAVAVLLASTVCLASSPAASRPGREVMYRFLDEGDRKSADLLLLNRWPVTRFPAVELPPSPTWTENPFNEKFWRFEFYGLRPLRHLVRAWLDTGDVRYRDRLTAVLESFAARGHDSSYAWDKHTTAFRGMSLVNLYVKLKSRGALPPTLERGLRDRILEVGHFLFDPRNFESSYNHGLAQAGALLLIAENFPELAPASTWRATALTRLEGLLAQVLDEDGVEVEQSPFYHFYFLTGFWEIYRWTRENGIALSPTVELRIRQMLRYATYIVLPDGNVAMLGTSVMRNVRKSQDTPRYAEMAATDPAFEYVLRAGQSGTPPAQTSILFPSSGQAVLRSSFGTAADFLQQTHVTFDVGPYRTHHSHLDALALQLYSAGKTLLPDSGHFSPEPGPDFDYFHGTRAHNTVVVDERDQRKGSARAGLSTSAGGWAYQSGAHELYDGVLHRRAVLLLRKDLVLVVDDLTSATPHVYEQTWHLLPGVELQVEGLRAKAVDSGSGRTLLSVHQLLPTPGLGLRWRRGSTTPMDGWYSERFELKVPNHALRYRRTAARALYVTVLASGELAPLPLRSEAQGSARKLRTTVCLSSGEGYLVTLEDLMGPAERVTVEELRSSCQVPR